MTMIKAKDMIYKNEVFTLYSKTGKKVVVDTINRKINNRKYDTVINLAGAIVRNGYMTWAYAYGTGVID